MEDQDNRPVAEGIITNSNDSEDVQGKSGDRGSGKLKGRDNNPSTLDRLQASGRLAFNAMTGCSTMPDIMPGQKTTNRPSSLNRPPAFLAEASSSSSSRQMTACGMGESLRVAAHLQSRDSSGTFDSFINAPLSQSSARLHSAQHNRTPRGLISEQEALDGAAVTQLLSLPDDPPENGDEREIDDGLCPAEAARLRDALFGAGNASSRVPLDRLLDFTPDYVAHPGPASSADAQLHVGTTDAAVAQSIWLQQWSDVLSAYTDEVWGDLGALAAEARHEIDQQISGGVSGLEGSDTNKKALRRLLLILAHVRGHA